MNRLLSGTLPYSILMKAMQIIGGALTVKVLTNILSVDEYGKYALVVSLSAFLAVIPFTGLNQGVFRYLKKHEDKKKVFSSIVHLYSIFLVAYSLLFLMCLYLNDFDSYLYYTLLILLSSVFFNYLSWVDNALEKQKKMFFIYLLDTITKILALYFISKRGYINVSVALLVISLSSFTWYIIGAREYFRYESITIKEVLRTVKPLWTYAKPIVIWSIFTCAQTMIYRMYLTLFESSEAVAFFTLNSSLAIMPITGVVGVVSAHVLPKLFGSKEIKQYDYSYLNKVLFLTTFALCIGILFFSIYSEHIVLLFATELYRESSWMLPFMFASKCIFCIGTIYSYKLYVEEKTRYLLSANIIPGVIAVLIGYFCVREYGSVGAVFSFVVSWSVCGLLLIMLTKFNSNGRSA